MNENFPLIELAPLEKFLRLTPWERMLQNDFMLNRWLEIDALLKQIHRARKLLQSSHVHPR
jgi:hypothetical protein